MCLLTWSLKHIPGNVCVSDPEHSTIDPAWLWSGEDLEVPHLHGEMSIITRNFNVVEIREYMNHFHQQYFVSASAFAINPHFQFTRKRTQSTNNINLFLHGIIIVNGWSKYFDYNIASGETPMIHIRVVINVCRKLHWVNTQYIKLSSNSKVKWFPSVGQLRISDENGGDHLLLHCQTLHLAQQVVHHKTLNSSNLSKW